MLPDPDMDIFRYPEYFSKDDLEKIIQRIQDEDKGVIDFFQKHMSQLTGKQFAPKWYPEQPGSMACIFLRGENEGTVTIVGANRRKDIGKLPEDCVKLYDQDVLSYIYLDISSRLNHREEVRKISRKEFGEMEELGKGSYGRVFNGIQYAVKISKMKEGTPMTTKYPNQYVSWYEVFIMKKILNPILEKGICPNIPMLYDSFTRSDCELEEGKKSPCIVTITELANGNLKQYLIKNKKLKLVDLYSCLFQVMAGLYAIQKYGQIMNFDVKKENVLYYNVKPGGYWHYRIMGQDFYVPNTGTLFVLNDFGISRSMSPKYPMYKSDQDKTFRLGSRYGIIMDGKIIPLQAKNSINEKGEAVDPVKISWEGKEKSKSKITSTGAEFRMSRETGKVYKVELDIDEKVKKYLVSKGLSANPTSYKFFSDPDIIPPFEFFNDTQDAIRMFIGGKRSTQRGHHKAYGKLPKTFLKKLEKYKGESESAKDGIFSTDPSFLHAGYFILKFFTEEIDFTKKVKENILESYLLS